MPSPIVVVAAPALIIAADGRELTPPGGEPVDLSRRGALRRILAFLAARRRDAPGVGADVDTLREAGWPGERMHPESANNRVYVAVTTLRKLGLRGILVCWEDGYLLDPDVPFKLL